MSIRVGIVGISGFGGGEAMRLVASHPSFELIYAAGEGSAGSRLVDRFPGVPAKLAELVIEKWDPVTLPKLDVLFASLPTGASAEALARVSGEVKIVDIGGDHRYVVGWAYGLADVWPAQIEGQTRVANPGCFPAATLTALAPLLANKLIEPGNIVIDAKTGISGAGRGGADSKFGYAESNENLVPYVLLKHVHMPEMAKTIERLSGGSAAGLVFVPHLVPMTRGILATCTAKLSDPSITTEGMYAAYQKAYVGEPFIHLLPQGIWPQTQATIGANTAHLQVAVDPHTGRLIAVAALDNLAKGTAGAAIQCTNLALGLDETTGLTTIGVAP